MIGSNADLSEYLKRVSKLSIDGRIKWSTGSGMSFYWDKPESGDLVSRVSIQRSESSIGDEYLFTVTRRPRTGRGAFSMSRFPVIMMFVYLLMSVHT